jgi:hypothetical protein
MKRIAVIFFVIFFTITILCGCGGGQFSSSPTTDGNVSVVVHYPQDMKDNQGSSGSREFSDLTVSYFLIDVYKATEVTKEITSPEVVNEASFAIKTTRINYPETTATIKGVPLGKMRFVIQGIDANNNLTFFGSFDLDVTAGSNRPGRVPVSAHPQSSGIVTGIITDGECGEPVANATVTIGGNAVAISDASGKYTIEGVLPGQHNITATAEGFLAYSGTVKVMAKQTTTHHFQMTPKIPEVGTVTGRVTAKMNDSDSIVNIAGAVVSIGTMSVVTGEDGLYTLIDVPVGTYTISVTAVTYQTHSAQVNVVANATTTHNIHLVSTEPQTGKLTGVVTDYYTGLPIPGAYVSSGGLHTYTLSDGSYTIDGIVFGTHYIFAASTDTAPNYNDYNNQVTIDTHTPVIHDIELITTVGTVTGTVTDAASSEPVGGVEVSIGAIVAETDASGNYTLEGVPQGTRIITAVKEGYVDYITYVNVVAGEITTKNFAMEGTDFRFTIVVPESVYTYTLPLTAVSGHHFEIKVDWGDGTAPVQLTSGAGAVPLESDRTYTYASAGEYQVRIDGKCPGFKVHIEVEMPYPPEHPMYQPPEERITYKSIDSWGYVDFREIKFYGCSNLESLPEESGRLNLVTSFDNVFQGCSNLQAIPEGLFDNNSIATGFNYTFSGCSSLTSIPANLFESNSNVTSFDFTFARCESLTSIPAGLFDGNINVTSFYETFGYCYNLVTIPTGLFDNNINVISFQRTFMLCESLESIPPGLFDNNTQVTTFTWTFHRCSSVTEIPPGLFDKNTAVTSFNGTFRYCSNIVSIPSGLFDNNVNVTNFGMTFDYCSKISAIPSGLFDNNTAVTSFSATFHFCSSITEIPPGLFDNNINVTTFSDTFYHCSGITEIPPGLFDNNTEVTSFYTTFTGTKITEIPPGLFDNNPKVNTFIGTFSSCTNLESIPAGLFDNNPLVTTFQNTFGGCSSLTSIPAGLFDNNTAVTNFLYTFKNCSNIAGAVPTLWLRTSPTPTGTECFRNCDPEKITNWANIPASWK